MAPSRGIRVPLNVRYREILQPRCAHQAFTTTCIRDSGHNRWSKIKHDKGKNDAAKNKQRSIFAQEIATASKLFGPDPNHNTRLADLIIKAKREGFAKASIEGAIARGQGRSLSGASLEQVTVEGILPYNVSVMIECETDGKLRTLSDVRLAIKDHGGTTTPASYLFTKRGKIVFEQKEAVGVDEVLEPALEAGATDVDENEEGNVVVFTEPAEMRAVGQSISEALGLQIATSDFIWDPKEETKVAIADESIANELITFVDVLQDREQTVQAVAMNVSQGNLSDDVWKELQSRLSV